MKHILNLLYQSSGRRYDVLFVDLSDASIQQSIANLTVITDDPQRFAMLAYTQGSSIEPLFVAKELLALLQRIPEAERKALYDNVWVR